MDCVEVVGVVAVVILLTGDLENAGQAVEEGI